MQDHQVQLVRQGRKVHRDLRGRWDCKDYRALKVRLGHRGQLEQLVHKARQVRRVQRVHKVHRGIRLHQQF
jgi:hypothetical protein